jgi:hypothetical protein
LNFEKRIICNKCTYKERKKIKNKKINISKNKETTYKKLRTSTCGSSETTSPKGT